MRVVFIVDIDTTIATNKQRAALLETECRVCLNDVARDDVCCRNCGSLDRKVKQSTWDAFLSPDLMRLDKPVPKAQESLLRMRELGIEFHFITGRNETLRPVTEEWLDTHFAWNRSREALYMRPKNHPDVPASECKEAAFLRLVENHDLQGCCFFFMEDDPYVFRMYQKYGIVIRCPEGWEHWMPSANSGKEPLWNR